MLDRLGPRVDSRLPERLSMETGLTDLVLVGQRPIRDSTLHSTPPQGTFLLPDYLERPRFFVHGYKSPIYAPPSKDDGKKDLKRCA